MALKLKGKLSMVVAAVAIMLLAACDTQPATDVTESAATLNGKGACTQGASGTWEYQVKVDDPWSGYAWERVGPRHEFSCPKNTGEVTFTQERARSLYPNVRYVFRLVSRLSNGSVQTWDASGTNGGTAYDSFRTQSIVAEEQPVTETAIATDAATAAAGCRAKEIKNERRGYSFPSHVHLWTVTLRTRWSYCPNTGQVRQMYPAVLTFDPTSEGIASGYRCETSSADRKVRAYSLGGNPEHVVWTEHCQIVGRDPVFNKAFFSENWCASNYGSGSGHHYRNGRCDLVPWGT